MLVCDDYLIPSYNLIHKNYKTEKLKKYNSGYASNLDDIIYPTILWIYGHTHKASGGKMCIKVY